MDLTTTPTPTTTPDTDNDTPPHTQQIKPISYANGTLKKHHYPYHHRRHYGLQQPLFGGVVIYKECLKNHAASIGGHALDGCGEFMPSPAANPTNPTSLKCAACGCHRNFHRREPDEYAPPNTLIPHFLDFRHPGRSSPSPSPPPPPQQTVSYAPQMLLALSSAVHEDHRGLNHHQVATPVTPTAAKAENLSGRKRFRTKFTQEQKEKMQSFSEKLGWKMQKCDDAMVEEFCNEIGVPRGVLKVWMHNNKNTLGKRSDTISNTNGTPTNINTIDDNNIGSTGRVNLDDGSYNMNSSNNNEEENNDGSHYQNETRDAVHLHASTNGSSPSS